MTRLTTLLALLAVTGPAWAESISTPQGVSLEVPAGFRSDRDAAPRETTIVYLIESAPPAGAVPTTIQVDHISPVSASEDELFAQTRQAIEQVSPDDNESEVTQLPSGRYLRADFDLGDPPRVIRKRYYMTLRSGHVFQLILSAEKARFEEFSPIFDAMVGGTTLEDPRPDLAVSPSPQTSATPAPTAAPSATPSVAPSVAPSAAPKPTPSATPSAAPRPTPSATPRPTASATPRPTASATPRPTASATPRPTASATPRPTASATASATPSATPRPTASATPSTTPGPAATPPSEGGNLLDNATVTFTSSEYDPDYWAASHLLDGRSDRGWCTSPGSKAPHRVVFALPRPARISSVSLDADCPTEPGFEGVAAKRFKLEVSVLGPERGFRQIAAGELVNGENDQAFPADSGGAVRWVRLTLLSNHGHPTLTELMELRVYGGEATHSSATTPSEAFRLERARTSREKNGAEIKGGGFREGERVWVNFKPRALAHNQEGKYWIEVDMILEDDSGNVLLRRDKVVDRVARLPEPPLSTFVAVHLDLPEGFPEGSYTVRLVARDRFGERSAAAACTFQVAPID